MNVLRHLKPKSENTFEVKLVSDVRECKGEIELLVTWDVDGSRGWLNFCNFENGMTHESIQGYIKQDDNRKKFREMRKKAEKYSGPPATLKDREFKPLDDNDDKSTPNSSKFDLFDELDDATKKEIEEMMRERTARITYRDRMPRYYQEPKQMRKKMEFLYVNYEKREEEQNSKYITVQRDQFGHNAEKQRLHDKLEKDYELVTKDDDVKSMIAAEHAEDEDVENKDVEDKEVEDEDVEDEDDVGSEESVEVTTKFVTKVAAPANERAVASGDEHASGVDMPSGPSSGYKENDHDEDDYVIDVEK